MKNKIAGLFSADTDHVFVLRKGLLALIHRSAGMISQYLLVWTVARFQGAAIQGNFAIAFTVLQLLAILAQLGLDNRLVRRVSANKMKIASAELSFDYINALRLTITSSALCALASWLAAPYMAHYIFHKPWLTGDLQITALCVFPFVLMGYNSQAFRSQKNMAGYLLFKAITSFLTFIAVVIGVVLHQSLPPIQFYTAACFIVAAASFIIWFRYGQIKFTNRTFIVPASKMISDALPLMLTGSVFFILGWMDNILIGVFRTSAEVGMYDVAFKISSLAAIVLLSVNAIQAPLFAELFGNGELKKLQRQLISTTRIMFYTSVPVTIACILFPSFILSFFGNEFRNASAALILLALGNFVNSITGSNGVLLQMTGHQHAYNRIIMAAAIASIIMHILFIPRYGIVGAAVSSSVAKVLQNTAAVIYAKRKLNLWTLYIPGIEKVIYKNKN